MVDVTVEFAYEAEQPDELTINVGDVIKNVLMVDGGWWEGELNGKKGMFPDNFVKVIKKEEKEVKKDEVKKKDVQASKRQSVRDLANKIKDSVLDGPVPYRKKDPNAKKKRAKVTFPYDPENDDELKLAVGDIVEIHKQEEEGWWEGTVNGKSGMFPSNFVEILGDGESGDSEEKAEPTPAAATEPDHLIKGKKVHGIGLGNIFGDGPIKLRSTAKKPVDRPQEPPKIEKRAPESPVQRRSKDTSACITNPVDPSNTSAVMVGTQEDSDKVIKDIVDSPDSGGLDHCSDILEKHPSFSAGVEYIDADIGLKYGNVYALDESDEFELGANSYSRMSDIEAREENLTEYDTVDAIPEFLSHFDKETAELAKIIRTRIRLCGLEDADTNNNVSLSDSMLNPVNALGKIYMVDQPGPIKTRRRDVSKDMNKDFGDFSDSLLTILDDLDTCLEQSYDEVNEACQVVDYSQGSDNENDTSLLSHLFEKSEDEFSSPVSKFKAPLVSNQNKLLSSCCSDNIKQTPLSHPNFSSAIDSVLVTKKRFIDSGEEVNDFTPLRHNYVDTDTHGGSVFKTLNYVDIIAKPNPSVSDACSPAINTSTKSYLASLNQSGNLSPFMRSIANKYQLFNSTAPHFSQLDPGCDSEEDNDTESYSTSLLSHTVDVQINSSSDDILASEVGPLEPEPSTSNQALYAESVQPLSTDMNNMVNNYVYEVLANLNKCSDSSDLVNLSCGTQSVAELKEIQTSLTLEDNESLAVCLDENSIRLLDTSSKDGIEEPEDEDKDSITMEIDMGGVLLYMTEGNEDSPPLSSCSPSLYPNYAQSNIYEPADEVADSYPPQSAIHDEHAGSVPAIHEVREEQTTGDCLDTAQPSLKFRELMREPSMHGPKLPDSGHVRQTSSFCRIPFSSNAPSFWFRKDFTESPKSKVNPILKLRSPKRPLCQIGNNVPSLLELAERVYYDDFQFYYTLHHPDSVINSVGTGNETLAFFNDRSPAKKRRKKSVEAGLVRQLSPTLGLNINANAIAKPYEMDGTLAVPTNTDTWGGVETYFASKIDTPPKGERELVASPANMDLQKTLSCTQTCSGPKIDWAKTLFGQTLKSNSSDSVVNKVPVRNRPNTVGDSVQNNDKTEPYISPAKPVHYGIYFSGSVESAVQFAGECSEKRKKRLFLSNSHIKKCDNPVQLLNYRKLNESKNPRRNIDQELANSIKVENTCIENTSVDESEIVVEGEERSNQPHEVIPFVLQGREMSQLKHHDNSVFVSPVQLRVKTAPLPEHVIEKLKWQIDQDDSNDVCLYFDHGDEPVIADEEKINSTEKKSAPLEEIANVQFYVGDDVSNTVSCYFGDDGLYFKSDQKDCDEVKGEISNKDESQINQSVSSLKEAVLRHIAITEGVTMAEADVMAMIQSRCEMYGAISEAVKCCSDVEVVDLEGLENIEGLDGELSDFQRVDQKGQNGYDVTPDLDSLVNELQGLDLSGTPQYASTQGSDGEMKEFLSEALQSLDNILTDSFTSSTGSPIKDDGENESLFLNTNNNDDVTAAVNDDKDDDTLEIKDDSVLKVVGTKCVIHEGSDEPLEDVVDVIVLEGEGLKRDFINETVEIKDDSILKIVGTKCHIHTSEDMDDDSTSDSNTNILQEDKLKVKEKGKNVSVRVREGCGLGIDYDEVFELDDEEFAESSDMEVVCCCPLCNQDHNIISNTKPCLDTSQNESHCQKSSTRHLHTKNDKQSSPSNVVVEALHIAPVELDVDKNLEDQDAIPKASCQIEPPVKNPSGWQERRPMYMCFSPMPDYYTTESTLQGEPVCESSPLICEMDDEYPHEYYCTEDVLHESMSLISDETEDIDYINVEDLMELIEPACSELNTSFCIEDDDDLMSSDVCSRAALNYTPDMIDDTVGLNKDLDTEDFDVGISVDLDTQSRVGDGVWCEGSTGGGDGFAQGGDIDGLDERMEDDKHWLKEHVEASNRRTDSVTMETSVMSDCPPEFAEKISTYPSPNVSSVVPMPFCQSGDASPI